MLDEAGYTKAALSLYGRALPLLSGSRADCLFRIARCNKRLGRLTDALEMYIEALRLSSQPRSADPTLRTKILLNLANVEYALSAAGPAMNHYRDGLRLAREIRDADIQIRCLVGVAVCQLDEGQYDEALGVLSQAEIISNSVGRDSLLPVIHTNQAVAYRALGRPEDAVQLLQQSLSEKRAAGQTAETLYSLNELTEIFIESGDLVQARLHSQEALLLVDSLHDARELSSTFELASRLALCADDLEAASNFVSRALADAELLPGWRRGVLLCLSAEIGLRTDAAQATIDGLRDISAVLKAVGKEESRK
jgi:tetratricopeptide (TPR) repeat protein